jgi:hypothetical protein
VEIARTYNVSLSTISRLEPDGEPADILLQMFAGSNLIHGKQKMDEASELPIPGDQPFH